MSLDVISSSLGTRPKNPTAVCIAIFALVFLCGAVVGALAMNMRVHARMHPPPFWTVEGKAVYVERMKKELDLTPVQTGQLETILDDFAKYYRTVLSDGKTRIMQILTDDQKQKFDRLLQTQKH